MSLRDLLLSPRERFNIDGYRSLFARVPDRVMYAVGYREHDGQMNLKDCDSCAVAWVAREGLAHRVYGPVPSPVAAIGYYRMLRSEFGGGAMLVTALAARLFGGDERDWYKMFGDAAQARDGRLVRRALLERVKEAKQNLAVEPVGMSQDEAAAQQTIEPLLTDLPVLASEAADVEELVGV